MRVMDTMETENRKQANMAARSAAAMTADIDAGLEIGIC
jgi:hypothetical protein